MPSKIIVITIIVLVLIGFSVLFIIEARNHSYDYHKAWSVVYFENPRDASLDFAIENHEGQDGTYGYQIFVGDNKVIDSAVDIKAGVKQQISPVINGDDLAGNRITIDVHYQDVEYKIYKDLK